MIGSREFESCDLLRETVVREGVSGCEDGVIGNTLQSDVTKNTQGTSILFTARRIKS